MRRGAAVRRAIARAGALFAMAPSVVAAQGTRTIDGVVVDTARRAVAGVTITVAHGPRVVTDDSGRFRVAVGVQAVTMDLRRIGFMPSRYGLYAGGDTTVRIELIPVAQQLPAVDVRATTVDERGFLERMADQKKGPGHAIFITADDIARRNPTRLTQMFDGMPGIIVDEFADNRYVLLGRRLMQTAGPAGAPPIAPCVMTIYIDGVRFGFRNINTLYDVTPVEARSGMRADEIIDENGSESEFDPLVTPSSVFGIEYYDSPVDVPAKYQLTAGSCGAVLIWTKHGKDQSP